LEQVDNFLQFATPDADDLMALDIENNDPSKWMSLADAEIAGVVDDQFRPQSPAFLEVLLNE
jgi:GH25 family lysozyme M1 (1,4-beta-N-acetylmuramidase)